MINIFDRKTSYKEALISNGLYDLSKMMISAETTEDIYGNYELNMEIELQGDAPTGLYEMLQVDNIIKVNDEGSEELFRIAQVNKGLEFIEVYCRHITISDSLNLWLDNVKPTNLNGAAALQWINSRTNPKSELIVSSNIAKVASANYVRKNFYQAMFEDDNAFVKRWGGEVKRSKQTIRIDSKLGQDKSDKIIIKEALNLTEFNAKSNIDEVSTVIYPVGFDGITAPRVESPLKDHYSMEFPIEIKYEDVKVKKPVEEGQTPSEQDQEGYDTLEDAQAELTRRAKAEFTDRHLDRIKFECDIDYIDLEKYEEYKDITALQTAFLGDVIAVRVDTFDMDIKARVVARKYDVLRNKRLENTISTEGTLKKPENIKDIIKDIIGGQEFPEIWEGLGPYVDQMIQAGFKNGYLVYEKNACYAVDQLPKEKAKNVVVLNKNGLGYSSTGISGPYKYGFTIDGKLNADMITTGTLHGQYIGAGTIEANKLSVKAKKEIRDGMATSQQFIDLTADVDGLTAKVGKVEETTKGHTTQISQISQKADQIQLGVEQTIVEGNRIKNGVLKGEPSAEGWLITPGLYWGTIGGHSGIAPKKPGSGDWYMITDKISTGLTGNTISLSAKIQAETNTRGAEVYIIGSRTSSPATDWQVGPMTFSPSGDYQVKEANNFNIPSYIRYIWVRIHHKGANSNNSKFVYVDWINLISKPEAFTLYGLEFGGLNQAVSNLSVKSNEIELSVKEKVNENEIISKINLSPESVKIKANKVEIEGDLVTKSNLTDGTTVISGSNIKTGTIESANLNGANIQGTKTLYMAAGGIMSCDGETFIKDLFIPETHPGWTGTGRFACEPTAWFSNEVHVGTKKGELWIGEQGVVKRSNNAWIQVNKLAIQNGSSTYLEIDGYKSNHVYGVDLWYSDKALKENINKIEDSIPLPTRTKKIGLDLIKNIPHYNFDYIQKKDNEETQSETRTKVECGYISQDLQKLNSQLVQPIKQNDGTTLLSPRPSFIIPNITLAIQEQQKVIEIQQGMIEKLEARIAALEAKQNV